MLMSAWLCGSLALVCAFVGGFGVGASGKEPTSDQLKGFAAREGAPVKAELIAEHASLQPGGRTRVGVSFELEEGWHIYAKEPGDAGLPTKITWSGPRGVTFGPLVWPVAQEFNDPGDIKTFGYSGAVVLASDLTLSPQTNSTYQHDVRSRLKVGGSRGPSPSNLEPRTLNRAPRGLFDRLSKSASQHDGGALSVKGEGWRVKGHSSRQSLHP